MRKEKELTDEDIGEMSGGDLGSRYGREVVCACWERGCHEVVIPMSCQCVSCDWPKSRKQRGAREREDGGRTLWERTGLPSHAY